MRKSDGKNSKQDVFCKINAWIERVVQFFSNTGVKLILFLCTVKIHRSTLYRMTM